MGLVLSHQLQSRDNRGTPYTSDEWRDERDWMLETYLPARSDIVLGQFEDEELFPKKSAPTFSQHGGTVSSGTMVEILEPNTNIYYTTDGSDPFSYNTANGAIEINATATEYENLIPITETQSAALSISKRWETAVLPHHVHRPSKTRELRIVLSKYKGEIHMYMEM